MGRDRIRGGGVPAAVLAVALLAGGGLVAGSVLTAGSTELAGACRPASTGPTVRGSSEQLSISGAPGKSPVRITGPHGFTTDRSTDRFGGLVVRDVPAGGPYRVSIQGDRTSPHTVEVGRLGDPPPPRFYDAQLMRFDRTGDDGTDGYLWTRDCTPLSYRVELPDSPMPAGGYDTVITYSGYAPGTRPGYTWDNRTFERFNALGYAVVGVNMRGTGCSGGAFDLLEPLVAQDGYDVVEVVAAQPWTHHIAMVGMSWPGISQLFVAATRPPSLAAIVPGSVAGDIFRDVAYPGGIRNDGFGRTWAGDRDTDNRFPASTNVDVERLTNGIDDPQLPGREDDPRCRANQALRGQNVPIASAWAAHPSFARASQDGRLSVADRVYNSYWSDLVAPVDRIRVPTLLTASWQDEQVGGRAGELLERFPPDTEVRLEATNGAHDSYFRGEVWHAISTFLCVHLRDHCPTVSRAAYQARPPIEVLLETDSRGRPRETLHLRELLLGQHAEEGQSWQLGPDLVPDRPDAVAGSRSSTFGYAPMETLWYEQRHDTATFTSSPLTSDTVMAGSGSADLWIAVPTTDVDLEVTLSEVRPDHAEQLVQSGRLRASAREEDPQRSTDLRPFHTFTTRAGSSSLLSPGALTRVRIELLPFAHPFRAGSRIRLTVSAPGAGANSYPWELAAIPGSFPVTIAHDPAHPSRVELPVLEHPAVSLAPGPSSCADTWSEPCRQLLTVTTPQDGPDAAPGDGVCEVHRGVGDCSLRAAVTEANAFPGGATVTLPALGSAPAVTRLGTGPAGGLAVTEPLLIRGVGATIDGQGLDPVFDVNTGVRLTLEGVAVSGGSRAFRLGGCVPTEWYPACGAVDVLGPPAAPVTATDTAGAILRPRMSAVSDAFGVPEVRATWSSAPGR